MPNKMLPPRTQDSGFTLTELLVVIATLAVLAMLVLPAFAATKQKNARAQCAANLRQIGIESFLYANDNHTWLPTFGGFDPMHPVNLLRGLHYTRYVWCGASNWNWRPLTNATTLQGDYENLGYLLKTGHNSNGKAFYCPGQWGSPLGEDAYLPFLTAGRDGIVRSSYAYNPRVVNPVDSHNGWFRRYQKTSDFEAHKLFAVDYLGTNFFAHACERGWNVLFTDGSANFSRSEPAYALNQQLGFDTISITAHIRTEQIFDYLEVDYGKDAPELAECVTLASVVNSDTPDFLSVEQSAGSLSFSWRAVVGKTYQVQYCTNLTQGIWLDLGGPLTTTNEIITTTDPNPQDPQRFYRIRTQK